MPLYEYVCRQCGSRFDAIRRMSERADAPACKACGAVQTELAVSAPAAMGGGGGGAGCGTNGWTGGG